MTESGLETQLIYANRERVAAHMRILQVRAALREGDTEGAKRIAEISVRDLSGAEARVIVFNTYGIVLPEGWRHDNPKCEPDGTCPVCNKPGDEVARGLLWMHPPCVRRVANIVTVAQIRAMEEA
jgi:hypothetical protein